MSSHKTLIAALLALSACVSTCHWTPDPQSYQPTRNQPGKDVIWVPTPQALVDRMLDMVGLTADDYLVDLGSGDGRLVVTAAKRGARAHGIEFDPDLVALSQHTARAEGVQARATFERADIFQSDFSQASVVTLFLLPELNLRLRSTLLAMKPGTRVVSNTFAMEGWQPDESVRVTEGCTGYCVAHRWVVPAEVRGAWRMGERQLVLEQSYQMLEGKLRGATGRALDVEQGRLEGARIAFVAGGQRYVGRVDGDTMGGTVAGQGGGEQTWSATRAR